MPQSSRHDTVQNCVRGSLRQSIAPQIDPLQGPDILQSFGEGRGVSVRESVIQVHRALTPLVFDYPQRERRQVLLAELTQNRDTGWRVIPPLAQSLFNPVDILIRVVVVQSGLAADGPSLEWSLGGSAALKDFLETAGLV